MANKEKKAERIWLGDICATIWTNENAKGGVWYNVTITRSYHDGDKWNDSTSFSRDDLPIVSKAADMAYARIWERLAASRQERAVDVEPSSGPVEHRPGQ